MNPVFKATQTPRCLSRPESQLPGLSLEAPPSPPRACHLCPSHTGPRSFPTHTHLPTAAPPAAAACSPTTPPATACHASWYHPQISKSSACVTFSEILPGSSGLPLVYLPISLFRALVYCVRDHVSSIFVSPVCCLAPQILSGC